MSQFANYSNTVQQLQDSVNQLAPTLMNKTDDAKGFEQEFLIGAALAAKVKATDAAVKLLKGSKTIKSIKGKSEAEIKKLVQSGQNRAEDLAKKLRAKITGEQINEIETSPSVSPENLEQLKSLSDRANETLQNTKDALESAENEMVDSRDAVRVASNTRDAAEAIVERNSARAVQEAGGPIRLSQQVSDAADRARLNTARDGVDSAQARAEAAESTRNDLAEQLVQHQNTADKAAADLQNAADSSEVSSTLQNEAVEASSTGEEVAEGAEKALKITKDVEEGSEVAGEADPLAFIVSGIAALATQLIGRRLKVHTAVLTSAPPPRTTYSSTLGASV